MCMFTYPPPPPHPRFPPPPKKKTLPHTHLRYPLPIHSDVGVLLRLLGHDDRRVQVVGQDVGTFRNLTAAGEVQVTIVVQAGGLGYGIRDGLGWRLGLEGSVELWDCPRHVGGVGGGGGSGGGGGGAGGVVLRSALVDDVGQVGGRLFCCRRFFEVRVVEVHWKASRDNKVSPLECEQKEQSLLECEQGQKSPSPLECQLR